MPVADNAEERREPWRQKVTENNHASATGDDATDAEDQT
jgi:hypothetical protein